MTFRPTVNTLFFTAIFMLLFGGFSLQSMGQINIVYKDKKADTVKLFENKKLLIDQLAQKEEQNRLQIERLDAYTKSLVKANDSLANGLSLLKKEFETLSKVPVVAPIIPEVSKPAPVAEKKPMLPAVAVPLPNVVPVYISSNFNLQLDSIKVANAALNERLTTLQNAIMHLKEKTTPPPAEPSHTLIYIFIGLLVAACLFLFSRIKM